MSGPRTVLAVALMGLGLGAGCAQVSEEAGERALEEALASTWRPGTGAEETTTAVTLPMQGAEPHRARLDGHFRIIESPGRYVRLERTIDRGQAGAWRVRDDRVFGNPEVAALGNDEGREGVYDGKGRFAARRRWGRWMERETLGGHDHRYLTAAYDIAPELLGAFQPYIRWVPLEETETIAGVPVRWERAELDTAVAPRPMEAEALTALRDHVDNWKAWIAATHRPHRLSGRLAFRTDGSREPVAGELTISGSASVEDRNHAFEAELAIKVTPLPPDASFAIPEDVLPARRPRVWRMIRTVMGDALAEPYQPK